MPQNKNPTDIFHKIRVKLYPNNLPGLEGTYTARTDNEACLTIEQVCAALKVRGGFTGNYNDLVKHVHEFFEEATYQLCDGFAVNTGLFSIHLSIGGVFDSADEPYDPRKNPVEFRFRTCPALHRLAELVDIEIVGLADTSGYIDEVTDIETGSVNETVTSGGFFSISGQKTKVVGDDPSIGVYFVSSEDPANEVKVARLGHNSSTKLNGIAPRLAGGLWKVAIKTQFNGSSSSILKKPRTMTSRFELNAVREK